jgi:hypothetical protein
LIQLKLKLQVEIIKIKHIKSVKNIKTGYAAGLIIGLLCFVVIEMVELLVMGWGIAVLGSFSIF